MKLEVNMAQVEPLDKYRKRKLGSIPSDWEKKELREIVTLISGQHINASDYSEEPIGIPYLTGPTDFQNERIVPTKYTIKPKACCKQNDILITVKGSGTGKTVISDGEYCISRQLMAIRTKKELTKYIYYHLKKSELNYNAESSGLIPGITREDILSSIIPVPRSEVESMKIGEILSTWDKAIELKEKLIEQKKEQKKGLMQYLLTGRIRWNDGSKSGPKEIKKRLEMISQGKVPEGYKKVKRFIIPREWSFEKIGKIAEEVSITNKDNKDYTVLSCTKYDGLVDSLKYFGKQVFSENLTNYKVVKRNHFVYATNHIEEGSIGLQKLYDYGLVSPMYTVFKTIKEVDNDYLFFLLKTETYRRIFETMMSASVDRRGSLRWKDFST